MNGETSSQLDHAEWLDLKRLSQYACVSEQTLRNWIHSPKNPLPASQRGGKIYVRKRDFDVWMRDHAIRTRTAADLTRIVDDILGDVARCRLAAKQVGRRRLQ